jgi:hypothetical protein
VILKILRIGANFRPSVRRYLRDGQNPLEFYNDGQFKLRFRVTKCTFLNEILPLVSQDTSTNRGLPIPPIIQAAIVLRFYATGNFQVGLCQIDVCCIHAVNVNFLTTLVD